MSPTNPYKETPASDVLLESVFLTFLLAENFIAACFLLLVFYQMMQFPFYLFDSFQIDMPDDYTYFPLHGNPVG